MNLKEARKKNGGYTQKELADMIGATPMTVSNWETGKTTPSARMWKAIADVLGVSTEDIDFAKKKE